MADLTSRQRHVSTIARRVGGVNAEHADEAAVRMCATGERLPYLNISVFVVAPR